MGTIRIYRTKLSQDRNAKVDGLYDYLSGLTAYYSNNSFQEIKMSLDIKIDIVADQKYSSKSDIGNYVVITQDNKTYYFFVERAEWLSKSAVRFYLKMDTINTFASDFSFNKKTQIQRQHKDRMIKRTSDTITTKITFKLHDNQLSYSTIYSLATNIDINHAEIVSAEYECTNPSFNIISHTETFLINNLYPSIKVEFTLDDSSEEDSMDVTIKFNYSKLFNQVDRVDEGFNAPLYAENIGYIIDANDKIAPSGNWYLIYRTLQDDEAIQKLLCSDNEFNFITNKSNALDPFTHFTVGIHNYIDFGDATHPTPIPGNESQFNQLKIVVSKGTDIDHMTEIVSYKTGFYIDGVYLSGRMVEFKLEDANTLKIAGKQYAHSFGTWSTVVDKFNTVTITKEAGYIYNIAIVQGNKKQVLIYHTASATNLRSTIRSDPTPETLTFINSENRVIPFSELKRTDTQLIKIIKLPYCPVKLNLYDPSEVYTDAEAKYDETTHCIDITDVSDTSRVLAAKNIQYLVESGDGPTTTILYSDPLDYLLLGNQIPSSPYISNRDDKYETKLHNSSVEHISLVYDSFNFTYKYEDIDLNIPLGFGNSQLIHDQWITANTQLGYENTGFEDNYHSPYRSNNSWYVIDYNVSKNFSSAMLFTVTNYYTNKQDSSYDYCMFINRNNEMPIYTSEYLNYVKTGQNYDVKSKQTQDLASGITTAVGITTTVAGAIATIATEGAAAPLLIGGVTTTVGGLTSSISGAAQRENAKNEKISNLRFKATNISQCDDESISEVYTKNKLKMVKYSVSDEIKKYIADLFYYCGYAVNKQDVPNTTSRYWFNFIQCEPVFNEENSTPYYDYLSDIKERYKSGVTVYHRNQVNGIYMYDWDQKKENWETSLI